MVLTKPLKTGRSCRGRVWVHGSWEASIKRMRDSKGYDTGEGSGRPQRIGIVGCGNVSRIYLKTLARFDFVKVVALADLDKQRAEERAAEFGVSQVLDVEALLKAPDVDIVANLTNPRAHADLSERALEQGKNVYSEKPLATDRDEGQRLLHLAKASDASLGCAPDTFLGGGLQTCRALLDSGAIGKPLAASAFFANHGMEHWHPNPAPFYALGAGPLFDVGVYYITALVSLLGPVVKVSGSSTRPPSQRTVRAGPHAGSTFLVGTPTHVSALLEFSSGPVCTLIASFDVWATELPRLELYGSDGTLSVPDPNHFAGPARLNRAEDKSWTEVATDSPYTDTLRGLGLAEMATALSKGRAPRASAEMAYHVLDVMASVLTSAERGRHMDIKSGCERPTPLRGQLEEEMA